MTDKKDLSGMQLDQYRLIRPLDQDQGGFAVVYLAEHVMYKTPVAIKVLNALSTSNIPDFILEAKVVLLEHPNIVRIRDFGVDKGYAYFTMNYLPNGSLRRRHASREPISWETIVIYTKQIAEALQYIHDKGVVHRDVKPENMLIGDNDDIQLSDFGIAITSYTINAEAQKVKGTPLYIAPEQIEGQAVRESDQYSLGAVMYEWLTGVPPFDGIPNEVLQKHLYVQPLALRKRNASVLPQVEAVVMKMLNKRREDRFSSMREFLLELERVKVPSPRMKHTPFTGHADAVQTLTWSPDGKYIASAGSDSTVQIWEPTTHKVLYVYPGHTGEVCSIMWSRDGKAIVSAGADEIVQVWEATTGYSLKSYAPHQGVIRAVAWSPNEMFIASTGMTKLCKCGT
jgi:serine/threonine protein kinase